MRFYLYEAVQYDNQMPLFTTTITCWSLVRLSNPINHANVPLFTSGEQTLHSSYTTCEVSYINRLLPATNATLASHRRNL